MRYLTLLLLVGCSGVHTLPQTDDPASCLSGDAGVEPAPTDGLPCATACRMVLYAFEERNHGGTADGECGLTFECPWDYSGTCAPLPVAECFEEVASANGCAWVEHAMTGCR